MSAASNLDSGRPPRFVRSCGRMRKASGAARASRTLHTKARHVRLGGVRLPRDRSVHVAHDDPEPDTGGLQDLQDQVHWQHQHRVARVRVRQLPRVDAARSAHQQLVPRVLDLRVGRLHLHRLHVRVPAVHERPQAGLEGHRRVRGRTVNHHHVRGARRAGRVHQPQQGPGGRHHGLPGGVRGARALQLAVPQDQGRRQVQDGRLHPDSHGARRHLQQRHVDHLHAHGQALVPVRDQHLLRHARRRAAHGLHDLPPEQAPAGLRRHARGPAREGEGGQQRHIPNRHRPRERTVNRQGRPAESAVPDHEVATGSAPSVRSLTVMVLALTMEN
ncbi:hypothetical protein ON010_g4396 [Phytophthora cinnamomi]|nr:hypothetical protein ON010_g4396 [Phytophthora cinnamomi]